MKRCEYKVPGGKLVCAKAEVKEGRIVKVLFSGDFFLLPETDLEDLEGQLAGMGTDPDGITEMIQGFFAERKTTIVGASPEAFAHVLNTAVSS